MKTLTVDIGTHVGWTLMDGAAIIESGTRHLATDEELEHQRRQGMERTVDIRFTRMLEFLQEKLALGVHRTVFEDVTFSGSPMQNQLWASLRAGIWKAAPEAGVAIFCVPVTSLKVFATGNTRADKDEMAQALAKAQPGLYQICQGVVFKDGRPVDDNEVDAIWLASYTAAVDRGEQNFLSAFQRKVQKREKQRASRRAAKAARKARKAQKLAEAKEKKRLFLLTVKATGRCCGVLRKPAPRRRAVCPVCGGTVKVPPLSTDL
jgi:hypothetical protein